MIDVSLPGVPELSQAFAACLSSVTEVPLDALPEPGTDLPEAIALWRSWLAGHGAGLVPIAEPARFNWPGYWIAVLGPGPAAPDGTAVLVFGTPAGVVLSPQDPTLLGRAARDLPVHRGYLVALLDPVLTAAAPAAALAGRIETIAIAEHATAPMTVVTSARAIAGRGLAGDRYAARAGTFTPTDPARTGYDLTLVQGEVLDDLTLPSGRHIAHADARRNLVTRGIDLNQLVGRTFRVGDVQCIGHRLCEPCAHLERLTTPGILRALIHSGGLRAEITTDGHITTGDTIETTDQP